jgi:putative ATP-dependent endonuclease of OLD family
MAGDNDKKTSFHFDEMPYFYMDAQRDIVEDMNIRNSYLSKMLSKLEYSDGDIQEIETQLKELNEKIVGKSSILDKLRTVLQELGSQMGTQSDVIDITPITKKIRDLTKGLNIHFSNAEDSFSMEYHGMGTRSWASLLTLKAFISLLKENSNNGVFFPILSIEEPESHLHPNAQKNLYKQIKSIPGQKIISTHSPYVAAAADLSEIRSFYRSQKIIAGQVATNSLTTEEIRQIVRMITVSRGEIFFSRLVVLVEGETEAQALPIFAKHYFRQPSTEMGIDFVGVGSCNNYKPFLISLKSLNIPWVILSDAEPTTKKSVNDQLEKSNLQNMSSFVIFLDDGNNFEKQLILDKYHDQIKAVLISFIEYENETHRNNSSDQKQNTINCYCDQKLLEEMKKIKTKFGPAIADEIILSKKELPPKIIEVFEKIRSILSLERSVA